MLPQEALASPVVFAEHPEIKSKKEEPLRNDSKEISEQSQGVRGDDEEKIEPRRQNVVAFHVAKSLPHALVGSGVYVTAVAVPLPGAPPLIQQENNDAEKENSGHSACTEIGNDNKSKGYDNVEFEVPNAKENSQAKISATESNSENKDTNQTSFKIKSSQNIEDNKNPIPSHNASPAPFEENGKVEKSTHWKEKNQFQDITIKVPKALEIKNNETIETNVSDSGTEVPQGVLLLPNKTASSKPSVEKQTLEQNSKRPKSSILKLERGKRPSSKTSLKLSPSKQTLGKPNVIKKQSPQKSNPPKIAKPAKEEEIMARSGPPKGLGAADTGKETRAPDDKEKDETEKKPSQEGSNQNSQQDTSKTARRPSTTTIISHESSIRPTSGALSKTATSSLLDATGTKPKSTKTDQKAPKPPIPRSSTPNKQLQGQINKDSRIPTAPKTPRPASRVQSAAPKRRTPDPRDEHNPFADRRAATSTPIAIVRPDDIARIKSAANKRLVHDYKVKTVRTWTPAETPVRRRPQENKKVAVSLHPFNIRRVSSIVTDGVFRFLIL